jgi:hypothetical protein
MRIAQANASSLAYWNFKKVDKIDDSCLTMYALKAKAETQNETMLQQEQVSKKTHSKYRN